MRQEKIRSIRNALAGKMEALWSIADDTISKMKNTDGKLIFDSILYFAWNKMSHNIS